MSENYKRKETRRLWFHEDYTLRDIGPLVGLEKTRVWEIIQEYKKEEPSIAEIKTSFQFLKKSGVDVHDVPRVAAFKQKLDKLGFPTGRLPDCVKLLDGFGENALDALNGGLKVLALESSENKSYASIVSEFSAMSPGMKSMRTEKKELNREIEGKKDQLTNLDGLAVLHAKLNGLHITPSKVEGFVSKHERLEELGFAEDAAVVLATQLAAFNTTPKEAAEKTTQILGKHDTLTGAITEEEGSLESIREEVIAQKELVGEWKGYSEAAQEEFNKQQASLDANLKKAKEEFDRQTKEWSRKLLDAEKRFNDLEKKAVDLSDDLNFAYAFTMLSKDPAHLTVGQVDRLIERLQKVKAYKEKGLPYLSEDEARNAKGDLVKGLVGIAGADVVPKSEFNAIKKQNEKLVEDDKQLNGDLESVTEAKEKLSHENRESTYDSNYVRSANQVRDDFQGGKRHLFGQRAHQKWISCAPFVPSL